MVTMEELVEYTLTQKDTTNQPPMIPKVVAEFRNITVGGAISGCCLESTSHFYGSFMDTVKWVVVRKGNGEVVKTFKGDSLWCSVSGTYGSMGIILEAAIECVICTSPYVQVSYYYFDNVQDVITALHTSSERHYEKKRDQRQEETELFLEGLEFPKEVIKNKEGSGGGVSVMMEGRPSDIAWDYEKSTNKIKKKINIGWKALNHGGPFYYEHVQRFLLKHHRTQSQKRLTDEKTKSRPFHVELISIRDYVFRYDDGAFWMARPMIFQVNKLLSYLPFIIGMFVVSHQWIRYITGPLFSTKNLFQLLKLAPSSVVASKMILQDCFIPITQTTTTTTSNGDEDGNASSTDLDAVISFLKYVRSTIPMTTPIWLCPIRSNSNQPFTPSYYCGDDDSDGRKGQKSTSTLFMNCAMYGRVSDGKGVQYTKQLEMKCHELHGRKLLYSQSYYNENTFWNDIYNGRLYEELRKQHDASDAFPDFYEKTCTAAATTSTVSHKTRSWTEWIASFFV